MSLHGNLRPRANRCAVLGESYSTLEESARLFTRLDAGFDCVIANFVITRRGNEKTMVVLVVMLTLVTVSCPFVIPTLLHRVVDVGIDPVKCLQYSIG